MEKQKYFFFSFFNQKNDLIFAISLKIDYREVLEEILLGEIISTKQKIKSNSAFDDIIYALKLTFAESATLEKYMPDRCGNARENLIDFLTEFLATCAKNPDAEIQCIIE